MKHSALTLVLALALCTVLSSFGSRYEPQRTDFTFRTEVMQSCDEDEDDWCHADSILLYLTDGRGNTEVRTVWAETLDTASWHGIGDIMEEDINFDGYPDLQVCNGPVNSFGNFTYTAFLWNQSEHRFVEVEGFDEINSPEIYAAEQQIVGVWRLDNDVDISTYEWRDGKLVLVNSEHYNYNELVE